MEKITTVGIDLAKSVFSLHGVDSAGRVVLRRTVRRDQLLGVVASLSPCLIGMEACSMNVSVVTTGRSKPKPGSVSRRSA
jgi:transposase